MEHQILIVDDDDAIRLLICTLLKRAGFSVVSLPDGYQALEALKEQTFDLIILDVMMPGLSGLDLCHELQRRQGQSLPPILMLSANTSPDLIQQCLDAGAKRYVTKPVLPRHFITEVQNLCGMSAA